MKRKKNVKRAENFGQRRDTKESSSTSDGRRREVDYLQREAGESSNTKRARVESKNPDQEGERLEEQVKDAHKEYINYLNRSGRISESRLRELDQAHQNARAELRKHRHRLHMQTMRDQQRPHPQPEQWPQTNQAAVETAGIYGYAGTYVSTIKAFSDPTTDGGQIPQTWSEPTVSLPRNFNSQYYEQHPSERPEEGH